MVFESNVICKKAAKGEKGEKGEKLAREDLNKKTGLLSQRMTQKPGEFSDSVLLEDYGDIQHPPVLCVCWKFSRAIKNSFNLPGYVKPTA
jgi:hypothetical protein